MISPIQRARVVIRHAWLAGSGEPVTRADVLAELAVNPDQPPTRPAPADPDPAPSGGSTSTRPDPDPGVDPDPDLTRGSDPGPTPDQGSITPITPAQAADDVVSLTDAAARLGVSVSTVRRYAAPSSGRLTRAGSGVTRSSLEDLAVGR